MAHVMNFYELSCIQCLHLGKYRVEREFQPIILKNVLSFINVERNAFVIARNYRRELKIYDLFALSRIS